MFRLSQPSAAAVDQTIAAALRLPPFSLYYLSLSSGRTSVTQPHTFARDQSRTLLGSGEAVFTAARAALRQWTHFDLGWVRVANPSAQIAVGQLVAVEVHSLGLWSLNVSRILDVVDTPTRFGYVYATTPLHVEDGEESFRSHSTLQPAKFTTRSKPSPVPAIPSPAPVTPSPATTSTNSPATPTAT